MSKLLPYEEQWLAMQPQIQLPDEDMAWADMKERLDEKKKRRFIFWWQWGCLGWGVFFGILGVLGLAFVFMVSNKTNRSLIPKSTVSNNALQHVSQDSNSRVTKAENSDVPLYKKKHNDSINATITETMLIVEKTKISQPVVDEYNTTKTKYNNRKSTLSTDFKQTKKKDKNIAKTVKPIVVKQDIDAQRVEGVVYSDIAVITNNNPMQIDSFASVKDTLKIETKKEDSVTIAENSNKALQEKKSKKIFFSAGVGLQQLIPVSGQKLTPYNASGRKGSLGDYIPSLFFKVHRGENWFLQTEFRYGAPQTTKSFVYKETNVPDTGINPAFNMITSTQLRKTFYHQLPLTINYQFNNKLSIGLGVQLNYFQAAIGEQSITKHDNFTQGDTLVSKTMLAEKNARQSGFAKTYLLAVGEVQYQWRRFFVGAKYTYGLQPYIRFSIDGQPIQRESSRSLQIMLRYQLWQSK